MENIIKLKTSKIEKIVRTGLAVGILTTTLAFGFSFVKPANITYHGTSRMPPVHLAQTLKENQYLNQTHSA
jgi:hypothetical protein